MLGLHIAIHYALVEAASKRDDSTVVLTPLPDLQTALPEPFHLLNKHVVKKTTAIGFRSDNDPKRTERIWTSYKVKGASRTPYATHAQLDCNDQLILYRYYSQDDYWNPWGMTFYCDAYAFDLRCCRDVYFIALCDKSGFMIDGFISGSNGSNEINPANSILLQKCREWDELPKTTNSQQVSDIINAVTKDIPLTDPNDPTITRSADGKQISRNGILILDIQTNGSSTTRTYPLKDGYAFVEIDADGDCHFEHLQFTRNGTVQEVLRRHPDGRVTYIPAP